MLFIAVMCIGGLPLYVRRAGEQASQTNISESADSLM